MSTHPIDGYALAGVLESGLPSEQLNRLTAALLDGVTPTDLESDTMLRTSLLDVLARWMRARQNALTNAPPAMEPAAAGRTSR